jgi:hypothetical protein
MQRVDCDVCTASTNEASRELQSKKLEEFLKNPQKPFMRIFIEIRNTLGFTKVKFYVRKFWYLSIFAYMLSIWPTASILVTFKKYKESASWCSAYIVTIKPVLRFVDCKLETSPTEFKFYLFYLLILFRFFSKIIVNVEKGKGRPVIMV